MLLTTTGRQARLRLAFGLTAAVLLLLTQRALPARADDDGPTGYIEVRFPQPVTTYTQPNPNSPIAFQLPAFSVVNVTARQIGTDGALWMKVRTPDGNPLGWIPFSVFLTGVNEDGAAIFSPFSPFSPFFPFFPIMMP